jgi:hypothetical protein
MQSKAYEYTAWSRACSSLREHTALIALVGAYFLAATLIAEIHGITYRFTSNLRLYALLLSLPLLLALIWHVVSVMVFVRPARLTHYLLSSLKPYFTAQRLLFAAPVLLAIPIFLSAFTFFKVLVPQVNPFNWDALLAQWDYSLHGGNHPWQLLQPVLGFPLLTGAINFVYHFAWFLITFGLIALQAFDTKNPMLRMRLLLSFLLSWVVIGTLGAIAFSSMGPCFDRGIADHSSPYSPLMDYLRQANEEFPIWALNAQDKLWASYQTNQATIGSGISAMPSMHVAIATLLALFGWHYSRLAGIMLTMFAVVIFIGSIHLAWHYALDGYVGALAAWMIWWLVGTLQKNRDKASA